MVIGTDVSFFIPFFIFFRFYLLSLRGGTKYDHFVFRLVSLWLNNISNNDNKKAIADEMKRFLPEIGCHKFICLLPQIVPRMNEDVLLSDIVGKIPLLH